MNGTSLAECLRLLEAADRLLLGDEEWVLAAQLSAVLASLRERAEATRLARPAAA